MKRSKPAVVAALLVGVLGSGADAQMIVQPMGPPGGIVLQAGVPQPGIMPGNVQIRVGVPGVPGVQAVVQPAPGVVGGGRWIGAAGPQQFIVAQPPPAPLQDQWVPARRPGETWVAGHWHWNGGQYQWLPGRWEMPPQQGVVWVPAAWRQQPGGSVFVPGHWEQPGYYDPNAYQGYRQRGWGLRTNAHAYTVGSTVTGMLGQDDHRFANGGYAEDYMVFLQAGQPVTFLVQGGPVPAMPGQRLDVYAQLFLDGQELAADDDGAGFPDARLQAVPPRTGMYILRISSVGSTVGEVGSYVIRSSAGNAGNFQGGPVLPPGFGFNQPPGAYGPGPGVQPGPVGPPPGYGQPPMGPAGPQGVQWLSVGQQMQGVLQLGANPQGPSGALFQDYAVQLQPGQTVTVLCRGGQRFNGGGTLDVMVSMILDGVELDHDDDSAGNLNSRLIFTAPRPGTYTLRVTTYGSGPNPGGYMVGVYPGAQPQLQ